MTLMKTLTAPVGARGATQERPCGRHPRQRGVSRTRPAPARPGGRPVTYRAAAVPMSKAVHRRRPITPMTTVALALVAAVVTVWLGLVADFGAALAGSAAPVPDQLGVVRVQSGETLQRLASRVAPGAPTAQVVSRIRELNGLDSASLDAGQTLVAPIG